MNAKLDCHRLVKTANDAVFVLDQEGRVVDANLKAEQEIGIPFAGLRGRLLVDLFDPAHRHMAREIIRRLLSEGTSLRGTLPLRRGDGSVRLHDATASPCEDDKGRTWALVISRDITEERAEEESILGANRMLREMVDAIPEFVHVVDPDMTVLYCSRGVADLTGGKLTSADVIGRNLFEVFEFLKGGPPEDEYRRVFETGERLVTTESNWWEGRKIVTLTRKVPVTDSAGRVVRVVTALEDITREKAAEEELARKNVELEALNKELNSFISMTSHELRSPLTNIEGFASLLADRLDTLSHAEIQEFVGRITANATRLHVLIDDLLTFARERKRPSEIAEVDLNSLLDEALGHLGRVIEDSGAAVTRRLEVTRVWVDRQKLFQIVKNLVENAVSYCREGVRPELIVGTSRDSGGGVVLSVADNGLGIPESEREVIFEIFRRGSGARGRTGTGVGLALVKENVIRLGGDLRLESTVGAGSTFSITLPQEHPPIP